MPPLLLGIEPSKPKDMIREGWLPIEHGEKKER
jgi:hypothetical protein